MCLMCGSQRVSRMVPMSSDDSDAQKMPTIATFFMSSRSSKDWLGTWSIHVGQDSTWPSPGCWFQRFALFSVLENGMRVFNWFLLRCNKIQENNQPISMAKWLLWAVLSCFDLRYDAIFPSCPCEIRCAFWCPCRNKLLASWKSMPWSTVGLN